MKSTVLILLLFLSFNNNSHSGIDKALKNKPVFSYKVFGNVANYFDNEEDLKAFFDFKKGDKIAEIGASDGQNIGGFSLLTDSLTFYVQDINKKYLNQRKFNKVIKRCNKLKSPLTNQFYLCIGTEKSTNLPDSIFDKIVIVSAFHEFTFIDEMVADISKKLKPDGKVYILETHCFAKGHKNYKAEETISIMQKFNFQLVKIDEKDRNNSKGLYKAVFGKTG